MKFHPQIKVYGDCTYRGDCPLESAEQVTFFNQIRKLYPDTYGAIAVHIRNEGKKTHTQVAKEKAEGMTTGASDVLIPGCPSFVCEIKRKDHTKSKWQKGQQEYLTAAQEQGAFVCVALGYEAALAALKDWILITKKYYEKGLD